MELLDLSFVKARCSHCACQTCWKKCFFKCPICRAEDANARDDPTILAALEQKVRETFCGAFVTGADVHNHTQLCIKCWEIRLHEKEVELEMLHKRLASQEKQIEQMNNHMYAQFVQWQQEMEWSDDLQQHIHDAQARLYRAHESERREASAALVRVLAPGTSR